MGQVSRKLDAKAYVFAPLLLEGLEAQAKAAGVAPSQLVQRLLMAALNGTSREEVHDDA